VILNAVRERTATMTAPSHLTGVRLAAWVALAAVVWGAVAFGAVYPWAYWPLAIGCALAGLSGLFWRETAPAGAVPTAFAMALAGIAAAVLVQLVPLPPGALAALSPATPPLLAAYNPPAPAGIVTWHSLSVGPFSSVTALALFGGLALLVVGLARAMSVTGARGLAVAIVTFGVLLALVAIIQKPLFTGKIYGFWTPQMGGSPFGPFVNKNHFAGWMLMGLPLALALLCSGVARAMRHVRPGWRNRLLWFSSPEASRLVLLGAGALVMALSLVLTMSRSGMSALALALALTGWLVVRRRQTRSRKVAATAYLVLVAVLVVAWVGAGAIVSRFSAADWSEFNNRRGAWIDAATIASTFPVAGTGLNTYSTATLFYQQHDLTHHYAQAHNDYLQLAAEGGLLLGIPILIALAVFIREVRRRFRERADDETTWWLRAGAVTGLTAIALQETVEFSLQMPGNAVLFAVLVGIAIHKGGS
jgi:O-antigen ligase